MGNATNPTAWTDMLWNMILSLEFEEPYCFLQEDVLPALFQIRHGFRIFVPNKLPFKLAKVNGFTSSTVPFFFVGKEV